MTKGGSIVHGQSVPELEIPRITSRVHPCRTEVLEIRGKSPSRSPILGSERTRSPSPLAIERRRPRSASPELQHTRPPVAVKRPKGPRPRASRSPTRVIEYRYHSHRPLANRSPECGTGQVNHIRRSSSPRDRHWYRRGTRLRSSSPQYDNGSRSRSLPRYSCRTRSHSRSPRYRSRSRSHSRSSHHRSRSRSRRRSRSHHLTRVSTMSSKRQRQDIIPPPKDGPPAIHTISESPPPIRAASSAPSANLLSAYL
ncbi:hypothetical protein CPB86DRAFT_632552 [Serendipita vermifera]|nr:hypothetical protein CPB86DRAFT_632552 [Serendipita vermifera]